jgi:hypothetical protein
VLNRFQLPTDVVFLIVLWRLQMKLSLRDLAEILLLRGLGTGNPCPEGATYTLLPLDMLAVT